MKLVIHHHQVPRETFRQVDQLINRFKPALDLYMDQLLWWNERINLISRGVSRETIREHIRHSLLLSQFEVFKDNTLIVDAGTGGGLPGLPLSITHPGKDFLLVDIVSKKIGAVKQMVRNLELQNAETINQSIENLKVENPFLLLSKHAFKINKLIHQTAQLPWKQVVFYKGAGFEDELTDNVDASLKISVQELFEKGGSAFYNGKVIVVVSRQE